MSIFDLPTTIFFFFVLVKALYDLLERHSPRQDNKYFLNHKLPEFNFESTMKYLILCHVLNVVVSGSF